METSAQAPTAPEATAGAAAPPGPETTNRPFVGPRPFESADQLLFFGREREAEDLVSLLVTQSEVLLYAASGAGKTSLLNASLIPKLREKHRFDVLDPARVKGEMPRGVDPAGAPNIFMFNALLHMAGKQADPVALQTATLASFLAARGRPRGKDETPVPRLVIFDQFEEILTSYPDCWNQREAFFAQVREALKGSSTLRRDDVLRPEALAEGLASKNGLSRYLAQQLGGDGGHPPDGAGGPGLPALVRGLNRLIRTGALYPGVGEEVPLTDRMRDLIKAKARSTDAERLNRMLLEEAFPGAIAGGTPGDPRLRVLFVMREDHVAALDPYLGVLPEKLRARYRLERLRPEAALQAVTRPLERTSRRFAQGVAKQLVRDLIETEVRTPSRPDYRVVVPPRKVWRLRAALGGAALRSFEYLALRSLELRGAAPGEKGAPGPDEVQAVCQEAWKILTLSGFEVTNDRLTRYGDPERSFAAFARGLIRDLAGRGEVPQLTPLALQGVAKLATWMLRGQGRVMVDEQFVEPVQLQVVCEGLWDALRPDEREITREHLEKYGDVNQSLSAFYEKSIREAARAARVPAWKLRGWFERELITPDGTRGMVFRGQSDTGGVRNAAVDLLEARHLIVRVERGGSSWYEIAHDRFIGPIQNSNRLWNEWLVGILGPVCGVFTLGLLAVIYYGHRRSDETRTTIQKQDTTIREKDSALNVARLTEARLNKEFGDQLARDGRVTAAAEKFTAALGGFKESIRNSPDDAGLRNELAQVYDALGRVSLRMGKLEDARANFEESRTVADELVRSNRHDDAREALSLAYERLGDLRLTAGDTERARGYYKEALDRDTRWYTDENGGLRARFAVSRDLADLGKVALLQGNLGAAKADNTRCVALRQECADEATWSNFYKQLLAQAHDALGGVARMAGNSAKARAHHEEALKIARSLWREDGDVDARRSLADAYRNFAAGCYNLGDLARAEEYSNKALKLYGETPLKNPAEPSGSAGGGRAETRGVGLEAKEGTAEAYEWLVDLGLRLGDTEEAGRFSTLCLALKEEIAGIDRNNAQARRALGYARLWAAKVSLQEGDFTAAEKRYGELLELREELAKLDPQNADAKSLLADTLEELADYHRESGNDVTVPNDYQEALRLRRKLADADPLNAEARASLAWTLTASSDASVEAGDTRRAAELGRQGLDLRTEIAASDLENAEAKQRRTATEIDFALVCFRRGDLEKAWDVLGDAVAARKALAQADPTSANAKANLGAAYCRLGDFNLWSGDRAVARDAYEKSLRLRRQVTEDAPRSVEAGRALIDAHRGLGDLQLATGDLAAARKSYDEVVKLSTELARRDRLNAQLQIDRALNEGRRGFVDLWVGDPDASRRLKPAVQALDKLAAQGKIQSRANRAAADRLRRWWDACQAESATKSQPEDLRDRPRKVAADLLILRAVRAVGWGNKAAALQTFRKLEGLAPDNPENLYDLARGYALCARASWVDGDRQVFLDLALQALVRAFDHGYSDVIGMLFDPDLAVVRFSPDYRRLVIEPREQGTSTGGTATK
jgi:tetratricopeptide (TPR) repeat protein